MNSLLQRHDLSGPLTALQLDWNEHDDAQQQHGVHAASGATVGSCWYRTRHSRCWTPRPCDCYRSRCVSLLASVRAASNGVWRALLVSAKERRKRRRGHIEGTTLPYAKRLVKLGGESRGGGARGLLVAEARELRAKYQRDAAEAWHWLGDQGRDRAPTARDKV